MSVVIFIHIKSNLDELAMEIHRKFFTESRLVGEMLRFEDGGLTIFHNKYDAKEDHVIQFPNEYFCFNHYIDYYKEVEDKVYFDQINKLLNYFWSNNIPSVAEGDCNNYDDELDKNKGYNQQDLPWPNKIG